MNTSAYTGAWQPRLKHANEKWMKDSNGRTAYISAGSFLSNGTPTPWSPEEETSAALRAGADIVFRLPAIAVLSGTDVQAFSTLTLSDKLGVISKLAIPVINLTREQLEDIAMFLFKEPLPYQKAIRKYMAEGMKFPEARARSLEAYLPGAGEILQNPVDNYAVELRLASLRRYSRVKLSFIPMNAEENEEIHPREDRDWDKSLAMKISAFLRNYSPDELAQILQMTPSFPWVAANTLRDRWEEFLSAGSFLQMAEMLESGKVTAPQIRRGLIMMLLGIRLSSMSIAGLDSFCPYIRVTGITEEEEAAKWWEQVLLKTGTYTIYPDGTLLDGRPLDESHARLAALDQAEDLLCL